MYFLRTALLIVGCQLLVRCTDFCFPEPLSVVKVHTFEVGRGIKNITRTTWFIVHKCKYKWISVNASCSCCSNNSSILYHRKKVRRRLISEIHHRTNNANCVLGWFLWLLCSFGDVFFLSFFESTSLKVLKYLQCPKSPSISAFLSFLSFCSSSLTVPCTSTYVVIQMMVCHCNEPWAVGFF